MISGLEMELRVEGASGRAETNRSDRPLLTVLGVGFLPWLTVVLLTAGPWAALHIAVYAAMALSVGYCFIKLALPQSRGVEMIFLSPALGILIVASSGGLWLRLGLPLIWVPVLWLVPAATGALCLWKDRSWLTKQTVGYGWTLGLLSLLVCLVYFLPSARRDAVHRPDGSFNWMYVDTQHFYAIAAGIKGGESPPVGPGTVTEELRYHFGPYVPAAIISRITGLDLGDALARVTRGASLWALVLSCFGLGTVLSFKATGERFGGIMSVAGLFFYGSLSSLFTNEVNGSSHVTGAILFKIPQVGVLEDGGPFSHLILGHSLLHGLVAITAIMGLCLGQRNEKLALSWRALILLTLPALAVPMNSVAALYSVGVVCIVMFWGRLSNVRSWLGVVILLCLFAAAWRIMGLHGAPDASEASLKSHMASQWWTLVIWFVLGLGFRIVAFQWTSKSWRDPVPVLVLGTFLGLLAFSTILQLNAGNERYGIYYLQSMFSLFAFCQLSPEAWRGRRLSQWMEEWLRLTKQGMLILIAVGVLVGIIAFITHIHTGVAGFGLKIVISFLVFLVLTGLSILMRRNLRFANACSIALACVLLTGFLAWITPWMNFGRGRMKLDVNVSAAEVQGLARLRFLASPGERFATNKHSVESLASGRERSYAYSALSEHPVLLEGYLDRGVEALPWFQTLLHDNELMFSTTNPNTLRSIASTYHVRWLVARPGTDISLSKPLPAWLVRQQDSGDLRIYRIN
ncbi:MAG: hypothetical protein QOE55_7948 [Acidobacteriaceae bacterium]|nr:hypothetical protein [Acidobacteriaceae bacterium]